MVCADTNSWIAYFAGSHGKDVELLENSLVRESASMVPVVLAELLSEPGLPAEVETNLLGIPLLPLTSGFWWRAGKLRASLLNRGYKPKLADTLIAQTCLDYGAALVTRDRDFRPFHKYAGLVLL